MLVSFPRRLLQMFAVKVISSSDNEEGEMEFSQPEKSLHFRCFI